MAVTADGDQGSSTDFLNMSPEQIQAMLAGTQSGTAPQQVVPLWVTRPRSAPSLTGRGRQEFGSTSEALAIMDDIEEPQYFDPDFAASAWIDLSDADKQEFAKRVQAAGAWEPTDGASRLVALWTDMVGKAAAYNSARPGSKDKWLSPFEAVEKLYPASVAGSDGAINGFTGWRTQRNKQFQSFTEDELEQTAEEILQRALGRNPTDDELKAYTIAANQEAKKRPQVVTTKTRDTAFDAEGRPIDSETVQSVDGEAYDPSSTIQDLVEGTQEYEDVQAATTYFPAVIQALNAVV